MRPLLRSPLLAALGGHKGEDVSALAARSKPKGAWKRFKRALHAELAWHKRAAHHAARSVKRCFTPRLSAEERAAGRGAGHAFRLVPAADWLGEDAQPPSAALFEVCVSFGWRGRSCAAAFRAQLRDGGRLAALEASFAALVAAAATDAIGGVARPGIAIVALLDDEPFARLDVKLSRKLVAAEEGRDAKPDAGALGLAPDVAERLSVLLRLCLKHGGGARASRGSASGGFATPRASFAAPGEPATRAERLAAVGEPRADAAPTPRASSTELAAADVPADSPQQALQVAPADDATTAPDTAADDAPASQQADAANEDTASEDKLSSPPPPDELHAFEVSASAEEVEVTAVSPEAAV